MKKIHLLLALPVALLISSCSEEAEPNNPQPVPGGDIKFVATLPVDSRTSYGPLGTESRPVYWTDGDLIQVTSSQCDPAYNNATYRVEVSKEQNYADNLVHTGTAGLRWGTETDYSAYKFYAVYPEQPIVANGTAGAEAAVHFSEYQTSLMTKGADNKWTPSSFDMTNNIMYAQPTSGQKQVTFVDGIPTANLRFVPFSTVLHLNFAGWKTDNVEATKGMTIFSVTLNGPATAPIAGNFPLFLKSDGSDPELGSSQDASSNSIKVELNSGTDMNGFAPEAGEAFECDIFMAPRSNMSIGRGWSIILETSAGNWSFDLGQAAAGSPLRLAPGAIHILNIPAVTI